MELGGDGSVEITTVIPPAALLRNPEPGPGGNGKARKEGLVTPLTKGVPLPYSSAQLSSL